MPERYSKTTPSTLNNPSTVEMLGPGPAQIISREDRRVAESSTPKGFRVALRKNVGPGLAESLLRYVNEFGQGQGTALVEDGLTWPALQLPEDREMLKSQFRDLFKCEEAAHGRCL